MLRSLMIAATTVICALPISGYTESTSTKFFIEADYLFWKAHLAGLESDFGTSALLIDETGDVVITDAYEEDIDPHFQWTPGFRLTAGTLFECSGLELSVDWTHFRNKGTTTRHVTGSIMNSGSCRVSLDQVDAVLACRFDNPCISIKPFLGMRSAYIKQKVNSQVTTTITLLPSTLAFETRHFDDLQYFKGFGPILGFGGECTLGCGFGIYGLAGFGLLYGNYNVHFNDADSFTAPISKEFTFINHQHLHRFNCNLDLTFGFYWRTYVAGKIAVELKIGFENHEYFNQSYLGVNRGDLSFNGPISSLKIAY